MTRLRLVVAALLILMASISAAQAPDFSGTWTLDPARGSRVGGGTGARNGGAGGGNGGGLALGPSPDHVVIQQTATSLVVTERRAEVPVRLSYALDGTKTINTVGAGRYAGDEATYTSTWKNGRLSTSIKVLPSGDKKNPIEYLELRYLDRDGLMIVETSMGELNSRRAVYVKAK